MEEFEGIARTREQTLERINPLQWTDWRPQGITLHNTAAADPGAVGGNRRRAMTRASATCNATTRTKKAGTRSALVCLAQLDHWFSDPLRLAEFIRAASRTRFGIEMVGDYDQEEFNSGDGAMVRDNARLSDRGAQPEIRFRPRAI